MRQYSPLRNVRKSRPSMESSARPRELFASLTFKITEAGRIAGRKESDRGQIGVKSTESTAGCRIGPPADRLYAVDPVGVDTISPSATTSVRNSSLTKQSSAVRCGLRPRCNTISFMLCSSGATRSPFSACTVHASLIRKSKETSPSSRFRMANR